MKILTEIFRDKGLDIHGKTDQRAAVRAVVIRGTTLLMVYSPVNKDYKFPGGGVDENENPEIALKREVAEECGMNLIRILQGIGCIVEYAFPMKGSFDVFKMTSSYYLCEVDSVLEAQRLDQYEEELGFQPVWVDINSAIQANKVILKSETKRSPEWTAREVFMLEYIKEHYLNST
jgi:8-oxo-dGTP pyrophosphatase MutT (NUDIX family)